MPTAELELNNVEAVLLGQPQQGLPTISSLLNITRLYNSVAATGAMGRSLTSAKKFTLARSVFEMKLDRNALHVETLFELEVLYRANTYFVLDLVQSLGRIERRNGDIELEQEKSFLRVATPLCKLFTAKCAVQICSEALENFPSRWGRKSMEA